LAQARRSPGLSRAGLAALALSVAVAHGLGCSNGARGGDALARRFPEFAGVRGQRLADANPYLLPYDGSVRFFHCHWPTATPVAVSLPPDASEAERRALDAALGAWEHAGLGVRFERVDAVSRGIEIRFVGGTIDTAAGQDTANTVVDCAVAPLSQQQGRDVTGAALALARIRIARITNPDTQGHQRPLTDAELAGTALHELGHALGFQGHARQGDTVMVREVEKIARAGRTLLADGGFGDASLRALYALPSGAVVASVPVDRCRTDLVDRMARVAETNHLDGPFVRVGESAGRIFWRDAQGAEYGLVIAKLREALRDPAKLLVVPESRVRGTLARVRDLPCAEGI
jgi:hypothetical protein